MTLLFVMNLGFAWGATGGSSSMVLRMVSHELFVGERR